jgi:hypothetical protein
LTEVRIEKIEELLINDEIEAEVYRKWKCKLLQQKRSLVSETKTLQERGAIFGETFEKMVVRLSTLRDVVGNCDFLSWHKLVKNMFQAGLNYDGRVFGTSYVHPALASCGRKLESIGLLIWEQPCQERLPIYTLAEEKLVAFIIEILQENLLNRNENDANEYFTDHVKISRVPDRDLNTLSN